MARFGLFVKSEQDIGSGIDFSDPNSPLAKYYVRFGVVGAVALIAVVFVLLNSVQLWHTDIWGHLKFGERLLDTRRFAVGDPFCPFAEQSGVTVNYAWLSQATLALAYRIGGWLSGGDAAQQLAGGANALRFLHSLLVAARLSFLFIAFQRLTRSGALAALGLAFLVIISAGILTVSRPQVFAELCFAALLVPLSGPRLSRRGLVAIPIVMTIWANAHASFPVGLLLLGSLTIGRAVAVLLDGEASWTRLKNDQQFRSLVLAAFVSTLAIICLNPEGPWIFQKTFAMASHPNVRAMDEWQPIYSQFAKGALITFGLCVLLILATFLATGRSFRPETWVPIVLFGIQPVLHQRTLVWFMTVTPWLMLPYYGRWLAGARPNWWSSVASFRKTLACGAIVALALVWSIPAQRLLEGKASNLPSVLSDGTPWQLALALGDPASQSDSLLAKTLKRDYPHGQFSGSVFASETLGDFFLWWNSPAIPVFIYSHVHLFSPEHWKQCTDVRYGEPAWRQILDQARVNLVVVEADESKGNTKLCNNLRNNSDWTVLFDEAGAKTKRDPRCRLFAALRKKPI